MKKELLIYGKADCPQCDKLLIELKDMEKTYLSLGIDYTREDLIAIKPANVRTFPVSFLRVNGDITYIKNSDINKNTLN